MNQAPTVHSFSRSLSLSQERSELPFWEKVYRQAFPTFVSMHCVKRDGWAQRGGIDRIIQLDGGKTLYIDEKIREKDYPDILLEYYSDRDRKTPGWIAKDLACDYIAYAFLPSQHCYLLPFQQLRACWAKYRSEWVRSFPIVEAVNDNYVTVSVAVPIDRLLSCIATELVVTW